MMRVHLNFLSDSDAEPFLQGNLRVLATRGVLMTIGGGLTGGLGALYVKTILGADAVTLGLFVSIWSAIYLIFVLIGGWVSDRYDRKKILLLGTALTLPNPLIYSLAPTWHILLLANSLGALGSALAGPAYTALLVSSVGQRKRARAIAAINTLTSLANLVVPPLGAFVVQWMGGLHEIRIMFLFQFILVSGVWVYTSKALQAMPVNGKQELGHLYEAVKDVFRQMRGVYRLSKERKAASWLYISLTGPLAWGVVGPFWTIYAAEVCGSPLFVLGLLAAIHSSTNILLQIPMANISDKRGRKYAILAGRPFRYLCLVALIVGGTYRNHVLTPMIPLLAWTLMGIADSSGPSWTVASTEVMPEEFQGKWNALRDFLWSITAIPASLAGGLLWNMDPRFPFIVALIVDGLFRLPVLVHQVPETLMSRCSYPRTAGSRVVIYGLPGSGQTSTARLLQKGTKARILDESLVKEESEEKGVGILRPLVDKAEKRIEKKGERYPDAQEGNNHHRGQASGVRCQRT